MKQLQKWNWWDFLPEPLARTARCDLKIETLQDFKELKPRAHLGRWRRQRQSGKSGKLLWRNLARFAHAHRTFFRGNPMTKICIKSERVAGSGKVWTTCGVNMSKTQPALFEKSSFQKPLFYYKKRSKIPKSGKNLEKIWNFFFLPFLESRHHNMRKYAKKNLERFL